MLCSLKTLALAALATTMYVAGANAGNYDPEYGGYDKEHFGIFIDKYGNYDKCAFDYIGGYWVDIQYEYKEEYGKKYKIIKASCKIPFWSHYDKSYEHFKCIYVDKNKYGREAVLYTRYSSFDYTRYEKYGYLDCEFKQKIKYPHEYPSHPYK
ncbi:MAG: hypothetical protein AB7I59_11105 [Geminicoccaceae bacterium]